MAIDGNAGQEKPRLGDVGHHALTNPGDHRQLGGLPAEFVEHIPAIAISKPDDWEIPERIVCPNEPTGLRFGPRYGRKRNRRLDLSESPVEPIGDEFTAKLHSDPGSVRRMSRCVWGNAPRVKFR